MKRIIIVECPESAKDFPVTMVVFSESSLFLRAEKGLKEVHLPTDEEISLEGDKYYMAIPKRHPKKGCDISFIRGANWLKSLLTCLFIGFMLTSCAVYPEPEPEVWQPRHSGTYQECDTVINGVTYYYFKKL